MIEISGGDHPAPSAHDLKRAADEFTEGPNIEASP